MKYDIKILKEVFEIFLKEKMNANQSQPPQNQETTPSTSTNTDEETIKSKIVGDYESFVSYFKSVGSDQKVISFLKGGGTKDKFTQAKAYLNVKDLHPTQSEIAVAKSLDYPLKDLTTFKKYLFNPKNIEIKGPILTFNGQYIIDGHHRWSQLYCINSSATISCIDLKSDEATPDDALKATQMSILALTNKITTVDAKGSANLLKISENDLKTYIETNISEGVKKYGLSRDQQYSKNSRGVKIQAGPSAGGGMLEIRKGQADNNLIKIMDWIWKNVSMMQQGSIPITNASSRNFMPQTDDAGIHNVANTLTGATPPDTQLGGFHTDK